jgi:hypothetical protein
VVVVLSEYPGLGWFGSKTYSTSWNGPNYWYEQGYAADDGGTLYPYAQGPFAVAKEFTYNTYAGLLGKLHYALLELTYESTGDFANYLDSEYKACITPGDSGSPVFAWWSDGPYIIGLTTQTGWVNGDFDSFGPGGYSMVQLINQARSLYP